MPPDLALASPAGLQDVLERRRPDYRPAPLAGTTPSQKQSLLEPGSRGGPAVVRGPRRGRRKT
jgi:hypothetical protein